MVETIIFILICLAFCIMVIGLVIPENCETKLENLKQDYKSFYKTIVLYQKLYEPKENDRVFLDLLNALERCKIEIEYCCEQINNKKASKLDAKQITEDIKKEVENENISN